MKPKLLTMSAFGSYGGVTQIDFERAGTGLFLITAKRRSLTRSRLRSTGRRAAPGERARCFAASMHRRTRRPGWN